MKKILLLVCIFISPTALSLTTSEFMKIMKTEIDVPRVVYLHFSGLMKSSLFWNAYQQDFSGKRFFCSPKTMIHKVEDHITMTYGYINEAGDTMRKEFKRYGQDFDEMDISQIHGLALLAWYSCE